MFLNQNNFGSENSFWDQHFFNQKFLGPTFFRPKLFLFENYVYLDFFSILIFDNLSNNLILLSNFCIYMEILGNCDTKTNQRVLTSQQLNLVHIKKDLKIILW